MRTLDMGVRIIFGFRPKKKGQTKALIEKMKQEGKPIDGHFRVLKPTSSASIRGRTRKYRTWTGRLITT